VLMDRTDRNLFRAVALKNLTGTRKKISFRRKRILFKQGEHANTIFHLDRGAVKLTITAKDGTEAVIGLFGGGSLLGEGCIDGEADGRTHTAEFLSDSQITEYTRAGFLRAIKEDPAFALELIEYLLRSNAKIQHELALTTLHTSAQRLARALISISDLVVGLEPVKLGRVNQQTLANMVGTSRQRVNSLLRHFEDLGMVSFENGLSIHESLRAFAPTE